MEGQIPGKSAYIPALTRSEAEGGEASLQEDLVDRGVCSPRVPEAHAFVKVAADDAGAVQGYQVIAAAACEDGFAACRREIERES